MDEQIRLIYITLQNRGQLLLSSMLESNNYECTIVTFWMFAKLNALGRLITSENSLRGKQQIVCWSHVNA